MNELDFKTYYSSLQEEPKKAVTSAVNKLRESLIWIDEQDERDQQLEFQTQ